MELYSNEGLYGSEEVSNSGEPYSYDEQADRYDKDATYFMHEPNNVLPTSVSFLVIIQISAHEIILESFWSPIRKLYNGNYPAN